MKSFLKKEWLVIIVYLSLSILFILPQLSIHYPTLIDDGSDLLKALNNSYESLFFKELFQDSRTKPLLLVYRKTLFDLFGLNLSSHFLIQSLLLFLLSFLTYILIKRLSINKRIAFISGLFIFILPGTVSNFYRLGTSEHLQILVLLAGLILIRKKWLALFFFSINCLIKENSIFFLITPFIFEFLNERSKKYLIVNFLIILGFTLLFIYKFSVFSDGYVNQSGLEINNIFSAIKTSPPTFIVLILMITHLIKNRFNYKKLNKYSHIIISFFMAFFTFFIWNMNQMYYHLTSQVLATIIASILFNTAFEKFKKSKTFWIVSLLIFFTLTIKLTSISLENGTILHKRHVAESALSKFILNNNFQDYSIYSKVNDYEANHKIHLYFTKWKINSEIKTFSPSINDWLAIDFKNKDNLQKMCDESENSFYTETNPKKILISKINRQINNAENSIEICGNSLFIKKYCEYYVAYK